MRKITKIKRMLMTEKGTSVVEIQRKLSVGYKEAKSLLQKLSRKYNIVYDNHTYKIARPRTKILKEKAQKWSATNH